MESIWLSALGRDVHVGDFYNYFNDNILPGKNFCFILLDILYISCSHAKHILTWIIQYVY